MVWWCCAVSMVTGTKACGWPLMANCILHSSFVNCCLPSSYFLLGHGTKPRTGGIRNGTSALQVCSQAPLPLCFSFSSPPFVPLSLCLPSFYLNAACALLTLSSLFFRRAPSEYVFTSLVPFSAGFTSTTSFLLNCPPFSDASDDSPAHSGVMFGNPHAVDKTSPFSAHPETKAINRH